MKAMLFGCRIAIELYGITMNNNFKFIAPSQVILWVLSSRADQVLLY